MVFVPWCVCVHACNHSMVQTGKSRFSACTADHGLSAYHADAGWSVVQASAALNPEARESARDCTADHRVSAYICRQGIGISGALAADLSREGPGAARSVRRTEHWRHIHADEAWYTRSHHPQRADPTGARNGSIKPRAHSCRSRNLGGSPGPPIAWKRPCERVPEGYREPAQGILRASSEHPSSILRASFEHPLSILGASFEHPSSILGAGFWR
jgi:hypothetical protein